MTIVCDERAEAAFGCALGGTMGNVIELKNVTKDYGDFKLDNVSFSVPEGCVCGFIGQNGAGKTTTIRMLSSVIEPTSGALYMNGMDAIRYHRKMKEKINVISGGEIFKRNEAKASDCERTD